MDINARDQQLLSYALSFFVANYDNEDLKAVAGLCMEESSWKELTDIEVAFEAELKSLNQRIQAETTT